MSVQAPVQDASRKLDSQRAYGRKPFWWKGTRGELAVVTSDAHNASLGIVKLTLFDATSNQLEAGIICKVRMETLCGIDDNITVFQSQENEDDMYLMVSCRQAKGRYFRDRRLNRAAEAQILRFVDRHSILTK